MNDLVKYRCKCNHLEADHKYRDMSVEKLLSVFSKADPTVQVIHAPDRMQPLGYQFLDGTYYTYEKAVAEAENARENLSACRYKLFTNRCDCKVFRVDNLKYLEELNEHQTSQIIH